MRVRRSVVAAVVTGVMMSLVGCGEARPETPEETFKLYLRQVFLNQDEAAWELIAPQDRAHFLKLETRLKEAGAASAVAPHETLLVRAILNPYALRKVAVVGEGAGDQATLEYEQLDGKKGEARMVKVEGQWYVKMLPGG